MIARFWAPQWNSAQALNKFQIEVGGPLHGGDPGRRLIEPGSTGSAVGSAAVPPAFAPRPGEWLVLPAWHIHGSEELSVLSSGVAERSPKPYLALRREDGVAAGLDDGQSVRLQIGGGTYALPVALRPDLPPGVALVPSGLPELPFMALPAWGTITAEGMT